MTWRRANLLAALALVVLGTAVVARFTIWAPVDERQHYEYVQSLAEHGRFPLITDLSSPEAQAIADRSWPRPSPIDPATEGLAGRSYEAFQPPLYYLTAAPVFLLVGDHRDKIFALRAFDALLFAIGAAFLALLVRAVAPPDRRGPALFAGLLVLAWPGLLVRGITVSNAALEFALTPAFLLAAWRAREERSPRWLATAAVLLGACVLTKLTLIVLAPCLLLAAAAVPGRARAWLAAPVAMLAPWLIANHARFGHWTANAAARDQQTPFLYPHGVPGWGVGDLPAHLATLLHGSVPQEWDGQLHVWWVGIAARALVLALLLAAVTAADRRTAFFALPAAAGVAFMAYTLLAQDWDIFLLRYVGAALAPLAVAAAPRHRTPLIAAAAVTALLWVDLAGRFLFTDVGAHLGI